MRYLGLVGGVIVLLCGAQARADEQIPDDFRFGLGMGVILPADLLEPNLTVASFYYKGMEIQPFVVLAKSESEEEADDGVTTSDDEASSRTRQVGAVFKYPLSRRDNMDLQFIGSIDNSSTSETVDPEGPDNRATNKEKSLNISYGLGLQWWFASHFSLMATAENPIFSESSVRSTAEQIGGTEAVTKSDDRSYGLVWDPSVSIAVMTWF
jgi:hypothetical protein